MRLGLQTEIVRNADLSIRKGFLNYHIAHMCVYKFFFFGENFFFILSHQEVDGLGADPACNVD